MAEKKGEAPVPTAPRTCVAPLPETVRGYGFHMNSTKKGDLFCYPAGRVVVIRSLKDPAVSDLFWEHKGRVTVAQFSPNGEWIASGDDQGTVMVWGAKNKIIKNTVVACRRVCDLCWSPDGNKIVAVGDGSEAKAKVFAWDSATNVGVIEFHSKPILSCSYRPTRPFAIATASEDLTVNFYSGPPFKWVNTFKDFERYPNCVRFSPDGESFAVVSSCPKIVVYEGKEGKTKVKELKDAANGHKGAIYSFAWSPDGKYILTASSDKTCKIWDVAAGTVVTTFSPSKKPGVQDMQMSCLWHDDYIISVSLNGAINYWDRAHPDAPKLVVQGHMHAVQGLAFDAARKLLFTSDQDGLVAAWDLAKGAAHWIEGTAHGGKAVPALGVSCDGKHLWSVGLDDKLKVTPVAAHAFSADAVALGGQPVGLAMAHADPTLGCAVLAQEKAVVVRAGKVAATLDLGFKPSCIAFAPNDAEVAIGGTDSIVHLFSFAGGKLTKGKDLTGHLSKILSVHYGGKFLVSTDANRLIHIWSGGQLQNPTGWTYHNAAVLDSAFPPNSTAQLATCSQDQDILVWSDLVKFEHKFTRIVLAHAAGADNVVFVDDKTLLSTGQDRAVKMWNV